MLLMFLCATRQPARYRNVKSVNLIKKSFIVIKASPPPPPGPAGGGVGGVVGPSVGGRARADPPPRPDPERHPQEVTLQGNRTSSGEYNRALTRSSGYCRFFLHYAFRVRVVL